jgi:hypothetical protein
MNGSRGGAEVGWAKTSGAVARKSKPIRAEVQGPKPKAQSLRPADSRRLGELADDPSPALTGALFTNFCSIEHPKEGNIQQPTSNIEHPTTTLRASIGCSLLDVGCWMFPGFMTGLRLQSEARELW